jgi:restriction system protein
VSWSGFKQSIERERAQQFFRVRLWNREDILAAVYEHYHQLPPAIRAEIPLKQIWTLNRAE